MKRKALTAWVNYVDIRNSYSPDKTLLEMIRGCGKEEEKELVNILFGSREYAKHSTQGRQVVDALFKSWLDEKVHPSMAYDRLGFDKSAKDSFFGTRYEEWKRYVDMYNSNLQNPVSKASALMTAYGLSANDLKEKLLREYRIIERVREIIVELEKLEK